MADNMVCLADNDEGLQKMLKALEIFCRENRLQINSDKTKCMIFNRSGRLMRRNIHINGTHFKNVRAYKYLGFLITPSSEVKSGLHDLRDRALKAVVKFKNVWATRLDRA